MIITSLDGETVERLVEPDHLQQISNALDELASVEPEPAKVVDLKFFCGFTLAEVASMQGVTERTVQRQRKRARLMLYQSLRER